jgi:hypothetical protein
MQHSQPQQSVALTLVLATLQHSCAGSQQSPSGQQLAALTSVVPAKQQACGGLQQSAPGAQQLIFMLDVPPPTMPRSSAKGARSFNVITDLHSINWLNRTVNLTRSNVNRTMGDLSSPRSIAVARGLTAPDALEQMERTGRRGGPIELLTGNARRYNNVPPGQQDESRRFGLAGSNAAGRRRKRSRAAARFDERSRMRRGSRMTGLARTTAACLLRRLLRLLTAAAARFC